MEDYFSSVRFVLISALIVVVGFAIASIVGMAKPTLLFLYLFPSTVKLFSSSQFIGFFGLLIAIVLGFDAINRERASRTPSKVVSQAIYRDSIINGKFLAGIVTTGVILVSSVLVISGPGIPMLGIVPGSEEVLRLVVYLVVCLPYVAFWLGISILFSVVFKNTSTILGPIEKLFQERFQNPLPVGESLSIVASHVISLFALTLLCFGICYLWTEDNSNLSRIYLRPPLSTRGKKYKWSNGMLVLVMIVLSMRLFDLQILRGDEMKKLSERNRVRIRRIVAPRGVIFDRTGKILANTRPSFNLYLVPEDIKDFSQTVDGLVALLDIERDDVLEKLREARDFPSSVPVRIASDLSRDDVAKVEANKFYLPGIAMQIEPRRNYPYGTMLSHVLGYVSEISAEELKMPRYKTYSVGDTIGKFGLERMYERYLRGVDGKRMVEVDASGNDVRILGTIEPVAGNRLYLNIDMGIQATVEHALEGKSGGAVVADPRTGGVLALVSSPAFDPNQLAAGSKTYWKTVLTDPSRPLQNRVIQGRYPPGSTFKPLVALAALEKGVISEHTTFTCPGRFVLGRRVFKCWQKRGHGSVSVHKGIVRSCDVFFYNVGLKVGVDNIHEMAENIGITKPTGIDLPGEKSGLVPSTEWKKRTYGQKWYKGETLSVAIGQGAVWLTPLELMQLASFIGNEGVAFKPRIVDRIVSPEGEPVKKFDPVMTIDVKLDKENVAIVKEAMKGVVNEPGGTAYGSARLQNVSMSGKTGTAQSGTGGADHAWFIAYAPSDSPAVVASILVEHGLHGSSAASPIAKAVVETMFPQPEAPETPALNAH
ncbi:MAG: Penicillin-binding protein 2B [Syntrophorhabdaceae bacterium PtaU1.Bin034]|nr:MAG: Penicillin-binding protein 2B [Syntrophorhabdaceae bacterium PtaU1.Bin034]